MNFSRIIAVLCLVSAVPGPAATARDQETPPSRSPNVVLIIGDDQAWTDFGFMGHEHIRTPNLDQLAAESLRFPRGYVPSSLCCPSLASILTGRFPHQHGITGNEPPRATGQRKAAPEYQALCTAMDDYIEKVPTLPRWLATRDYLSLQTGKWWHGSYARGGFTHGMTHGEFERGGRHGDEGLKIGREGMQPIAEFLDHTGAEERPFFLWYAPFLPHTPHNPPQRLLEHYRSRAPTESIARYWAMCEWLDETVGSLREMLAERSLAENTLILFVVDNGWINQPDASRYAPRSKRSPYDGGLRTPILVHWPGQVSPATVDVPVSSIDLAPTILVACGIEIDPDLPGVDLLDETARAARSRVTGAVFLHNAVDLHRPGANLTHRWSVEGDYKLIVPHATVVPEGRVELFHVTADPEERHDLAGDQPERVARMLAALDAWWDPDRPADREQTPTP